MFERDRDVPACVYALADSLDAVLATCEDLQSTTTEPSTLLPLERVAVTHVLQARQRICEFDPLQPGLVHGCASFLVATAQFGKYLKSDILELASTTPQSFLPLPDDHLIAGQVCLSVLACEAGKLLDALEDHFLLYDDEQSPESEPPAYRTAPAEPTGGDVLPLPGEHLFVSHPGST